ncbi:kinase-like domain-containing protein [Mucidula mucida]|nr:kinase-like domain-containing protein [Mucidula mucida]
MEFLQTELDASTTIDTYRFTCIKCLRALGRQYDLLPDSFICRDVKKEGESAIWGGGFADIWQGTLSTTRKPVCLKILRLFVTTDRTKMFKAVCHEALVWRQLRHPNVLPFVGINNDLFAPCFCLISEWMKNGNIMGFLLDHPNHDRLQSIVDIAEGIRYLHDLDPQIVHADIRGANVLVSDDFHCVLADFGISLMAETQAPGSTTLSQGTTRWLPPEMIDTSLFEKAYLPARDIYSFGCTVIEMYTGKPPFSNIRTDIGVINEVIVKKRMPPRPTMDELPCNELWEVLVRCLAQDARDRPTASNLLHSLRDLSDRDDTSAQASTDHGIYTA